jgi:hypothetical protein
MAQGLVPEQAARQASLKTQTGNRRTDSPLIPMRRKPHADYALRGAFLKPGLSDLNPGFSL